MHHKFYVYRDKKKLAIGLPGWVFLYRTPVQTQNLHEYHPTDHRPPCDGAIFDKIWGSFGVPVVYANKCVGVLQFAMDTPKDSYDNEIDVLCRALQHAGFQSPNRFQTNHSMTYTSVQKRSRKTDSSNYGRYWYLAQHFGLSSDEAIDKIAKIIGKPVKPTTFTNACRNVAGIPEWPCIKSRTTKASSDQMLIMHNSRDTGIFQAPIFENVNNQIACDASSSGCMVSNRNSFGVQVATEGNYFGAQFPKDYMASETSSFRCAAATDHMSDLSSLIPIRDVEMSARSYTQSATTNEVSSSETGSDRARENFPEAPFNQIEFGAGWNIETGHARENFMNDFVATSAAIEYMHNSWDSGIFQAPISEVLNNQIVCDASNSGIPMDTENASFGSLTDPAYMVAHMSSFDVQVATEGNSFGAQFPTEYMASETSSFRCAAATVDWDVGTSERSYTYSSLETGFEREHENFPEAPFDQIQPGAGWNIETERARENFMNDFDEMQY